MTTQVQLPRGYLSISQVRSYLRCPKQYEYQYVMGLRSVYGSSALLGRSFHQAIETANKAKLEDGEILSTNDVLDVYNDAWKKRKCR